MATGLRLDTAIGTLRKRLGNLKQSCQASEFRSELERFARDTLKDCIAATPVRNEALIVANQRKQYRKRVDFIPSAHELIDPSLRVNENGEPWIYTQGKWYNGNWHLPDEVFAAFAMLDQERQRRMATIEATFINERKQARFLYQRSWWQVANSLGLSLSVSAAIISSHSRHNPKKEPTKAYGQWRGGMRVLSVVIVNTFLDVAGKYWKGNGKAILKQATAKNYPSFIKRVNDKVKRKISLARQSA